MFRNLLKKNVSISAIVGFVALYGLTGCASSGDGGVGENTASELFSRDLQAGHYEAARQDLAGELRRNPHSASAWNNLALLDFKAGHEQKADGDLSQGLALDPHNTFLLLNRARLSLARHQYKKARKILLSLEGVRPWPRGFRLLLAIADLKTGHRESSRLLLEEILSERPHDPMARAYLSRFEHGSVRG
uniref:Uncharacterized protein n=1 Tax=Leptospirillum ferriphilum TaxID=178606 RepID=A0A7C3R3U1_9BACT